MSMKKRATFSYKCPVKALNKPTGKGWDIFNLPNQIKTASIKIEDEDLGGFDLKEATQKHPDHLYIKVFAIKKDEPNDNGDAFSEEELKKAAHTFVGVPLFTNHQNDDVEKARGECVHSWYDEKDGGIYIIGRVDKVAYPRLARGIESEYITGCFPPDSPVLMADGTEKNICDIEGGDYVISGKGNIRKVNGIRYKGYKYPLYSLSIEGIKQPLVCTAHHNLMVYRLPSLCSCGCEEEMSVRKDKRITSKAFNRKFKNGHVANGVSPDFKHEFVQKIKACDIREGDFLIEPKFLDDSCDSFITEDEAFLIGLFSAEGSFEKREGIRHSVTFNFAHTELETLAFQCEEKLNKVFKDYRNRPTVQFYPDSSQTRVCLYGKEIADWFYNMCGEYSDNKKLDQRLLKLGKEKTASLIAGFIEGDGYTVKNRNYGLATVSANLSSQFRLLLDKIGVRTNYRIRTDTNRYGYKPVHEITFGIITVSDLLRDRLLYKKADKSIYKQADWHNIENYTLRRVKDIKEIEYDGVVYDIEVEEDHTYCINHMSVSNTSMGAAVDHSLCSVCHNFSHTADQYCSHVKNGKNRKFSGEIKCKYHDSETNEKKDKCPLCGSTKDDVKILKHSEQQIYEHNYGLKFIENSFVVNPACHDCGVRCVLHIPEMSKKVASLNNTLSKIITSSHEDSEFFEENAENIVKLGGVQELESLKNSMTEMENVVNSMLKQKDNVSMEYVSDLVKAMADVQNLYDELMEMGYGALPSPSLTASGEENINMGVEKPSIPKEPYTPQLSEVPSQKSTGSGGQSQVSDLGGLGTITLPKNSSKKIKDFLNNSENIINKVSSLENDIKILINNSENIGVKMSTENKTQKVAAGSDNLEVITEKQLEKKNTDLHPRTDEVYEGITESKEQIGGEEKSNDTISSSPQVRMGTYETVTEDQLRTESAFGSSIIRFGEYPDVITEKQWNDFSRDVASDISSDYTESITQAQIRDLLSKHRFIGDVETITEDQLKNISMTDGLKRWANKNYSVNLVKSAMSTVADLISVYNKSPEEIQKISFVLSDDMSKRQKAAYLTIINSLPKRKEERKSLASKSLYFSKTASKEIVSIVDSLILSASEHGTTGMKVEDLFDFVGKIVNDKKAMEKVNNIVKAKDNLNEQVSLSSNDAFVTALKEIEKPEDGKYKIYAKVEEVGVPLTKKAEFLKGVKKIAQEAIGDDSVASAVIKIEVNDSGDLIIDIQDTNISEAEEVSIEDFGDVIEDEISEEVGADLHGEECPFEEEVTEDEENDDIEGEEEVSDCGSKIAKDTNKSMEKKAQMMGGEMGGQGGMSQGPGAGASLPGAPGEAPPMESFTDEGMEDEFGEEDMEESVGPLPPGSICPVCGSEDVDIVAGKGKCNNCGSEMTFKVEINVTKWQGVTPDEENSEVDDEFEGEGFEMPEDDMGEMPSVAAYTRLKPEALKKIASSKIELGSISPSTGLSNTVKLSNGQYACLDTGVRYKVSFVFDKKDPKKGAYAQWEWTPRIEGVECPSCVRNKQKFIKALASVKMTEEKFNKLSVKEQADTIIQLKKAGALKEIKIASKNSSVLSEYKLAYGNWGNSFPLESCIEKLARRFGDNAVCLSGPDEGRPLAESICNRLKKADVYSDKIAIKLAEGWSDCDGDEECIAYQVRSGYTLREASSICESLKVAVAQAEDFLADEIEEDSFSEDIPTETFPEEGIEDSPIDDVDPFEDEGGNDTITLEFPKDVVEQISQEVDMALGEEGPIEESPIEEGPIEEGPIEEGPIEEGPIEESPIEEGPIEESPIEESPIEEVSPEDLGETSECTKFKEDLSLNKTKKVTINVNGVPIGEGEEEGGEIKPIEGEEDIMDETLANENEYNYKEAQGMKSKFGKTGRISLDLSTLASSLEKKAGEKEVTQEKAQDSKDIGQYSAGEGGSLMGHENETIKTPKKPSVPRSEATMGQEPNDLNPKDKPQPVIPSENATMGHEEEAGLGGGDNRYTGGTDGQGEIELASTNDDLYHMKGFGSSKKSLEGLARKIADKLEPKKPVSEDKDIHPISDGGVIGKEEKFTADDPENTEGSSTESLIGHEKETIDKAPKSPEDHPDINTGNAQMGKEDLDSEKTTKDKGTVIANVDSESEAIRVAGRMLQSKKIEATDLYSKIKELKQYKPEQIRDFEKSIFASQKGLDSVSDGISQSIQINENSSIRKASDELTEKLQGLFTLGKRNVMADRDEMTQVRKTYGK